MPFAPTCASVPRSASPGPVSSLHVISASPGASLAACPAFRLGISTPSDDRVTISMQARSS